MQVFSGLFIGYLLNSPFWTRTSIAQTVIWDHPDVQPVQIDPTYGSEGGPYTLQEATTNARSPIFRGLSGNASSSSDEPLAEAFESLFQTIVVAAMAEASFQ